MRIFLFGPRIWFRHGQTMRKPSPGTFYLAIFSLQKSFFEIGRNFCRTLYIFDLLVPLKMTSFWGKTARLLVVLWGTQERNLRSCLSVLLLAKQFTL